MALKLNHPRKVLQVMGTAKGLLEAPASWTRYTMARNKDQQPVLFTDPNAQMFCLAGALHRAGANLNMPPEVACEAEMLLNQVCIDTYKPIISKHGSQEDMWEFHLYPLSYTNDTLIQVQKNALGVLEKVHTLLSKRIAQATPAAPIAPQPVPATPPPAAPEAPIPAPETPPLAAPEAPIPAPETPPLAAPEAPIPAPETPPLAAPEAPIPAPETPPLAAPEAPIPAPETPPLAAPEAPIPAPETPPLAAPEAPIPAPETPPLAAPEAPIPAPETPPLAAPEAPIPAPETPPLAAPEAPIPAPETPAVAQDDIPPGLEIGQEAVQHHPAQQQAVAAEDENEEDQPSELPKIDLPGIEIDMDLGDPPDKLS